MEIQHFFIASVREACGISSKENKKALNGIPRICSVINSTKLWFYMENSVNKWQNYAMHVSQCTLCSTDDKKNSYWFFFILVHLCTYSHFWFILIHFRVCVAFNERLIWKHQNYLHTRIQMNLLKKGLFDDVHSWIFQYSVKSFCKCGRMNES